MRTRKQILLFDLILSFFGLTVARVSSGGYNGSSLTDFKTSTLFNDALEDSREPLLISKTSNPSPWSGPTRYDIPSSSVYLMIYLKKTAVLNVTDYKSCLASALPKARQHKGSSLVNPPFEYKENTVVFKILGSAIFNKLKWEDVWVTLGGLIDFFQVEDEVYDTIILVRDEQRESLGEANLRSATENGETETQ